MNQNIVYVGIDVDDVRYHGSALNPATGEMLEFHCRPTMKGLVGQLEKLRRGLGTVQMKLCYEASYVGFSLQRDLQDRGYDCAVVAPSSIPRRAGKSVKTDRIDAAELAEFFERPSSRRTSAAIARHGLAKTSKHGANSTPEYIAIADRCLRRLNKKGNRLLLAGKHPNKVKVACAREMVGFIWESLHRAAA
jgi:hypothetical protein